LRDFGDLATGLSGGVSVAGADDKQLYFHSARVVDALTMTYIEVASLPRTLTSPPNLIPMKARPLGVSVPEGDLSFEIDILQQMVTAIQTGSLGNFPVAQSHGNPRLLDNVPPKLPQLQEVQPGSA